MKSKVKKKISFDDREKFIDFQRGIEMKIVRGKILNFCAKKLSGKRLKGVKKLRE